MPIKPSKEPLNKTFIKGLEEFTDEIESGQASDELLKCLGKMQEITIISIITCLLNTEDRRKEITEKIEKHADLAERIRKIAPHTCFIRSEIKYFE
jgi:hypothetical protein